MSQEIIEMVHARKLPAAELMAVDDHLAGCVECRDTIGASFAASGSAQRFELAITSRNDHLTYDQLEAYVDKTLSTEAASQINEHIGICADCEAQLSDLQKFAGASPVVDAPREGWLSSIFRNPIPAFAAIAAVIAVIAAIWMTRPGAEVATTAETTAAPPQEVETAVTQPDAGESAASVTEPSLPAVNTPQNELVVSVNDGDETIGLSRNGELAGYSTLDTRYRKLVKNALATGKASVPDLRDLSTSSGVLMGDNSSGTFRILSPIGKVISTDAPTFTWQPVPGAGSYVVEVFDRDFNKVASSGELKNTSWKHKLDRAKIYTWQVTAVRGDERLKAPQRPQPDARFRILDQKTAAELSNLKRNNPRSHFLLGVAYANAGLIDEAIREFEISSRQNPASDVARKMLRQLRTAK